MQEDEFIKQSQKDVLFRAFGIWHSKTMVNPSAKPRFNLY